MAEQRDVNVPAELRRQLLDAAEKLGSEAAYMYYQMAYRIIWYFVGSTWADENIKITKSPNLFMRNFLSEDPRDLDVHFFRVIELADILFILKDFPGFDIYVDRLRHRDTQAAYEEGEIARLFVKSGYEIKFSPEVGRRGYDFDFTAVKQGQATSVEVTHIESAEFVPKALLNKLNEKRDQVSTSQPAVLCIYIQDNWTLHPNIETEAERIISDFFRRSRRFGCIMINFDRWHNTPAGAGIARARRPYFHPNPYHVLSDILFTRSNRLEQLMEEVNRKAAEGSFLEGEPMFSEPFSYIGWVRSQLATEKQ